MAYAVLTANTTLTMSMEDLYDNPPNTFSFTVDPGSAEDFLTDHNAEGYPDRHLPQRNAWRQYQGIEDTGYQKSFVDFMFPGYGE